MSLPKAFMQQLLEEKQRLSNTSLRRLFENDEKRATIFSINECNIYFDYSKNHIDKRLLTSLLSICEERQLQQKIYDLLSGKLVNNTEKRPALHSALRFQGTPESAEEQAVFKTQEHIKAITQQVHAGKWLGHTGKPIQTVINIGIGGSDLGPRMVVQALSAYKKNIDVKFVANIDGTDLCDALQDANPETTLFIIASKSFTTLETLENALSAREWMLSNHCQESQLQQHFIAISTNISAAQAFGIASENILPMWDWVGGRYSLWSAIGISIAMAIGDENFSQLLCGAHKMDKHFAKAPFEENMPVIAALLTFWYSQCWGSNAHAVLPYAQRLSRLPAFLQQLDMESLGKSVTRDGNPVSYTTGNIIWGTEGTNGQHSFHQLLHQGTLLIPVDFITVKKSMSSLHHHHQHLQACCISQSQALLQGKTLADAKRELRAQGLDDKEIEQLAPHKVIKGNKPSNTLILDELNPENLGALLAFYEHKVYTLGVLLDINPFDQWGVELGKQLGKPLYTAIISGEENAQWDSSTRKLLKKLGA